MISQYRKGTGINMINFEEELKNFKPSMEVEDAEELRDLDTKPV